MVYASDGLCICVALGRHAPASSSSVPVFPSTPPLAPFTFTTRLTPGPPLCPPPCPPSSPSPAWSPPVPNPKRDPAAATWQYQVLAARNANFLRREEGASEAMKQVRQVGQARQAALNTERRCTTDLQSPRRGWPATRRHLPRPRPPRPCQRHQRSQTRRRSRRGSRHPCQLASTQASAVSRQPLGVSAAYTSSPRSHLTATGIITKI